MDVWIKIGLEFSMKSSALVPGNLSSWNSGCQYLRMTSMKLNTLEKITCKCLLWRRQHYFRIIRIFTLTLPFGIVIFFHLQVTKFARDLGGSMLAPKLLLYCALNACDDSLSEARHSLKDHLHTAFLFEG